MTKYILNTMVILLTLMLYRRKACGFIKNSLSSGRKAAAVLLPVGILLACAAVIIFLTFFEACFICAAAAVGFFLRHRLADIFRAQYARKHGRLHAAKTAGIICLSLWLWLALFYRTEIGEPIGMKNYLYHKYNEEFKFLGVRPDKTNNGFYPINGDRKEDCFNLVRKKYLSVGSRLFASDNYYGIIIRDDYQAFCKEIIEKYYGNADDVVVTVRFDFSGLSNLEYMSDELDRSTSLEEFFKFQKENPSSHNSADITVRLPTSYFGLAETQDMILGLTNGLAEKTNCVSINFVYDKAKDYGLGYTHAIISYYGEVEIYSEENLDNV